jgi:hypothetical protein
MHGFISDLRFLYGRCAAPIFCRTVILILELGIAANTAVFTQVNAVLLKSLPVTKPEQLFRLGETETCCVNGMKGSRSLFPCELINSFRENAPAFDQLAGAWKT